ncbi:MAG: PKD domain-containing protein [bacterium]
MMYIAYECQVNAVAYSYYNSSYNFGYYPTTVYDGGDTVKVGAGSAETTIRTLSQICGSRKVPKLDLSVDLKWLGNSQVEIIYTITNNHFPSDPPSDPVAPDGVEDGVTGVTYQFSTVSSDPEGNDVYYRYDFGDNTVTDWLGPYTSGDICTASHAYATSGNYGIIAQAKDSWDYESGWSPVSEIKIWDYMVGDANGNNIINILDIVYLIEFLYKNGPAPDPFAAGDANYTITVNILDIVYLIEFLYKDGPAPIYPN